MFFLNLGVKGLIIPKKAGGEGVYEPLLLLARTRAHRREYMPVRHVSTPKHLSKVNIDTGLHACFNGVCSTLTVF